MPETPPDPSGGVLSPESGDRTTPIPHRDVELSGCRRRRVGHLLYRVDPEYGRSLVPEAPTVAIRANSQHPHILPLQPLGVCDPTLYTTQADSFAVFSSPATAAALRAVTVQPVLPRPHVGACKPPWRAGW